MTYSPAIRDRAPQAIAVAPLLDLASARRSPCPPMKLSIVIPCYNEAKTIRQIVECVRAAAVPGVDKEIIVAGDGSAFVPRETPPLIR